MTGNKRRQKTRENDGDNADEHTATVDVGVERHTNVTISSLSLTRTIFSIRPIDKY